jgi:hypothetical protein
MQHVVQSDVTKHDRDGVMIVFFVVRLSQPIVSGQGLQLRNQPDAICRNLNEK